MNPSRDLLAALAAELRSMPMSLDPALTASRAQAGTDAERAAAVQGSIVGWTAGVEAALAAVDRRLQDLPGAPRPHRRHPDAQVAAQLRACPRCSEPNALRFDFEDRRTVCAARCGYICSWPVRDQEEVRDRSM